MGDGVLGTKAMTPENEIDPSCVPDPLRVSITGT